MLERLPGNTVVLDVMNPPGRYIMFFLGKVPSFRAGWKTGPERETDQRDGQSDDTFCDGSAVSRSHLGEGLGLRIINSHLQPARP